MEIKVEVLSKELIKPSSPTPLHLRKHHFSFIDQIQATVSVPFVYFYEKSDCITNIERSKILKQSLSNTLAIFYPLAGRINNYSYVHCNDEGALFVESKAYSQLSDILQNRNYYHNNAEKFILMQPEKGIDQYGSLFQITYFSCGGLAVSFAMPHMLGDALSQLTFLKSWAAVARGDAIHDIPFFASASIFPPRNIPEFNVSKWILKENVVTKSFVFDAFIISALRDKYSPNDEKLSRARALTTFILTRIMAVIAQVKEGGLIALNLVNVRPLLDPPSSNQVFGNLILPATTVINIGDDEEIPRRLRDSLTMMTTDIIKELQGEGESKFLNGILSAGLLGEIDKYTLSNLCNFPIYDIDFGWGNPAWVAGTATSINNLIIFTGTKEGRGIEAWISMTEENMTKFEKDEVLLSHLSPTPNGNPNFISRL